MGLETCYGSQAGALSTVPGFCTVGWKPNIKVIKISSFSKAIGNDSQKCTDPSESRTEVLSLGAR